RGNDLEHSTGPRLRSWPCRVPAAERALRRVKPTRTSRCHQTDAPICVVCADGSMSVSSVALCSSVRCVRRGDHLYRVAPRWRSTRGAARADSAKGWQYLVGGRGSESDAGGPDMTVNIGDLLRRRTHVTPNTEALVEPATGRRMTYRELNA